ncbi:MAG: sulfate adenylyltransferase [Blastocatellia bacterium]
MSLISPHGGTLINREAQGEQRETLLATYAKTPGLRVNGREEADLELLGNGALSPLEGFLGQADYLSVRDNLRLANGQVWSIPVTLSAKEEQVAGLKPGTDVPLRSRDGHLLAVLHLEEIFERDLQLEAWNVYRTTEDKHPGVSSLYDQGKYLLGGKVTVLDNPNRTQFPQYRYSPAQLRTQFEERGWERVVAFQTRNPVHRAHEYIQKCAMEIVDGLLLHPIVGETKSDDIPAPVRMKAYEVIIENYYPEARTKLAVLPAAMRYAGPREAIFHALIRKNYGCSHFIVGRDHAGVGSYYGTYDAQKIFLDFTPAEIGITPLYFDNTFFCRKCDGMASLKTCPHGTEHHVSLSGTKVREMLNNGEIPPIEFTRPEVAQVLIEGFRNQQQQARA